MATLPDPRPNRQQINRDARRLRSKPGWDPARFVTEDAQEQLRQVDQRSRDEKVYGRAGGCPACTEARTASGDETALCEQHLREAMGM